MKVLVFGATGGTGRQIVEQALAQGHTVTAFVRTPAKVDLSHPNLTLFQGDVMDAAAVERAMVGQEAVLSALGAPASQNDTVRSDGTLNIIRAMKKSGVDRFVCMTTLGMGDSWDNLPLHFKYFIVPFILRGAFADSERQESYVKQSDLDWTLVRPANLTDGKRTGVYQHGFPPTTKGIKLQIARADVADFMLNQLNANGYVHKMAGLSY